MGKLMICRRVSDQKKSDRQMFWIVFLCIAIDVFVLWYW